MRKKLPLKKLRKKAWDLHSKDGGLTRKMVLSLRGVNRGVKNGMWKGDKAGIKALHRYMEKRILKPKKCQCCKKRVPYDLANKGIYNRDSRNWEWICRSCHMKKDGRMSNLRQYSEKEKN